MTDHDQLSGRVDRAAAGFPAGVFGEFVDDADAVAITGAEGAILIYPGETLKDEFLKPLGLTQVALAATLGSRSTR